LFLSLAGSIFSFHQHQTRKSELRKKPKKFRASGVVVGQKGPTATHVFAPGGRQKEEASHFEKAVEKKRTIIVFPNVVA